MCPINVLIVNPLVTFHILIVLSKEPLANKPSCNTARELTEQMCPVNVLIVNPLATFQIIFVSSQEPLANKQCSFTFKSLFLTSNVILSKVNIF